jgi:xanthine dehydrogenase accessory factor
MNSLINDVVKELESGQPVALATILTKNGSAPRTAGAEMLVRPDGSIAGTIGGGLMEALSIQAAMEVLQLKRPAIKEFFMTGKDASTSDMICGGNQEVLVEYLDPADARLLQLYKSVVEIIRSRKQAWWVTRLPDFSDPSAQVVHALVKNDGNFESSGNLQISIDLNPAEADTMHPSLEKPAPILHLAGQLFDLAKIHQTEIHTINGVCYVIDPVDIYGTVYIFGGGHVSRQVAIVTHLVGFRTVVLDDRPEFITPERFPEADDRILVTNFADSFKEFDLDPNSYIVIVTRGHLNDRAVLVQALRTQAVYIGMIGSKRKCAAVFDQVLAAGFTREDIARVHAPIGLDIDADSPEEIAISIVGELIQVRANLMK